MNILLITEGTPFPIYSGSAIRLYPPLRILARQHTIGLCSISRNQQEVQYIDELHKVFSFINVINVQGKGKREWKGRILNILSLNPEPIIDKQYPLFHKQVTDTIRKIIQNEEIDVVYTHRLNMAQYTNDIVGVSKVLDLVDSEFLFSWRELTKNNISFSKYYVRELFDLIRTAKWEARIPRFHDATLVVSPKDLQVIRCLCPSAKSRIQVIPNGVDIAYYSPAKYQEEISPETVIFHGHMSYPPNVDAMLFFCNKIMPMVIEAFPDLRLLIVGKNPSPEIRRLQSIKNVEVTGFVEDIRPFLSTSNVCIYPLRRGGGIRNKILEAMAMGKPVITTSIGAEALCAVHGKHLMVEDHPDGFAHCIIELLRNERLRNQLGFCARQLVVKQYSWERTADQFEDLYTRLMEARRSKS